MTDHQPNPAPPTPTEEDVAAAEILAEWLRPKYLRPDFVIHAGSVIAKAREDGARVGLAMARTLVEPYASCGTILEPSAVGLANHIISGIDELLAEPQNMQEATTTP